MRNLVNVIVSRELRKAQKGRSIQVHRRIFLSVRGKPELNDTRIITIRRSHNLRGIVCSGIEIEAQFAEKFGQGFFPAESIPGRRNQRKLRIILPEALFQELITTPCCIHVYFRVSQFKVQPDNRRARQRYIRGQKEFVPVLI